MMSVRRMIARLILLVGIGTLLASCAVDAGSVVAQAPPPPPPPPTPQPVAGSSVYGTPIAHTNLRDADTVVWFWSPW